jgi:hypothetical protein
VSGRSTPDFNDNLIFPSWPIRAWDVGRDTVARLILRVARHPACRGWHAPVRMHQVHRVLWWAVTLRLPLHTYYWVRARRAGHRGVTRPPVVTGVPPTASHINLPRAAHPTVSIIIPTFGQTACTLHRLAAIAAHPPLAPIEVIVVDDASGDPAVAQLD